MNELTIHSVFETALFLFGQVWPALGAFFVSVGILACISGLRALWDACNPKRPREWTDWDT